MEKGLIIIVTIAREVNISKANELIILIYFIINSCFFLLII